MELLGWLEDRNLSVWMRESDWGIPIMLCFHAVGMGIVVGVSLMFGARVLGYSKHFPLAGFDVLFRLASVGFVMNALSGTLMFIGEPRRLLMTTAFVIKMALIVCAGFALWALSKALESEEPQAGMPASLDGSGRRARCQSVDHPGRENRRDPDHPVLARRHPFGPPHRLYCRTAAALGVSTARLRTVSSEKTENWLAMTDVEILHRIRETWLGETVRESTWLFAAGETLHFVGLSMLFGSLLIVDLRLLGFTRTVPMRAALAFLPFAIIGFTINPLTGIEFFVNDPFMYWPNPAFRLKMFLILVAGLNALVFTRAEYVPRSDDRRPSP